ncbi:Enoyl-[acyl-carrier-protein] reductase FMN [Cytobacillus firmus]|uniref:Probable nitronate monooxygenase n=1 Tax=Cytobacillus firmus TaxID=1399 RepID=A0A800MVW3_CYTFI|nr:Enoyl-[acyl-carrier-protein] reductase FMN [Cytobacillus firmus]
MGWKQNSLTARLGIQYPIFQAPMAGGLTTPELISGVSNCGGLGNMGAGYMMPDDIRADIKQVRELTDQPFGINLFVPDRDVSAKTEDIIAMVNDTAVNLVWRKNQLCRKRIILRYTKSSLLF